MYYSDDDDEYHPPYLRPHRTSLYDPKLCHDLPEEGERIDSLVDRGGRSYFPAIATNVDETTCTFIVDPLDHTAFGPKTVRTFWNKYGYIAVTAFGFMFFQNEIKDSLKDFMDSLKKDEGTTPRYEDFINRTKDRTNSLPLVSSNQDPTETDSTSRSGTYKGFATEWNNTGEVTQDVKSTLVFNDDGSVKGSGLDALDGPYTIAGKWRISNGVDMKVNWKETYDDFSVTVSGNVLEGGKMTRIKGKFRSSFGYKGTFEIFK